MCSLFFPPPPPRLVCASRCTHALPVYSEHNDGGTYTQGSIRLRVHTPPLAHTLSSSMYWPLLSKPATSPPPEPFYLDGLSSHPSLVVMSATLPENNPLVTDVVVHPRELGALFTPINAPSREEFDITCPLALWSSFCGRLCDLGTDA